MFESIKRFFSGKEDKESIANQISSEIVNSYTKHRTITFQTEEGIDVTIELEFEYICDHHKQIFDSVISNIPDLNEGDELNFKQKILRYPI